MAQTFCGTFQTIFSFFFFTMDNTVASQSSFHAFNDGASIFKAKDWLQVGAELGRGVLHVSYCCFLGALFVTFVCGMRIGDSTFDFYFFAAKFYNMVFGGTPEQTAADANRILFSQDSNILAEVSAWKDFLSSLTILDRL